MAALEKLQGPERSPETLKLALRDDPCGVALLGVTGDLDLQTAAYFRNEVVRLLRGGTAVLLICMEKVGFIDSSGLDALVAISRLARRRGVDLRVVAPTETSAYKVLQDFGIDVVFTVHTSVAAALHPCVQESVDVADSSVDPDSLRGYDGRHPRGHLLRESL